LEGHWINTSWEVATKVVVYSEDLHESENPDDFTKMIQFQMFPGCHIDGVTVWEPLSSVAGWATSGFATRGSSEDPGVAGKIPGCSRIGDIYEIVFASMERIEPASILPATLEKDNHIIRYNRVNDLSDHTTSMTIRGS